MQRRQIPIFRLVWLKLSRLHRHGGFGIQSPFAFNLVKGVIYERGEFYAYERLAELSRKNGEEGRIYYDRLMMRLANDHQPRHCLVWGEGTAVTAEYIRAGKADCLIDIVDSDSREALAARLNTGEAQCPDMIYVASCRWPSAVEDIMRLCGHNTVLAVANIHESGRLNREWKKLIGDSRCRVSFDIPGMGIAYFMPKLNKQNYIVGT